MAGVHRKLSAKSKVVKIHRALVEDSPESR